MAKKPDASTNNAKSGTGRIVYVYLNGEWINSNVPAGIINYCYVRGIVEKLLDGT